MILFINSSQADLIQVKLIDQGKIISQLENNQPYKQSEFLLKLIDEIVGSKIKKIKAMAVVSGPGAFSALRLGVTTANALAWSLNIPIIEVNASEAQNDELLLKVIKEKNEACHSSFIIPKYGQEPNITKIKK